MAPLLRESNAYDALVQRRRRHLSRHRNDFRQSIVAIGLTSTAPIFAFDGDGIEMYGAPVNLNDMSGYGGPNAWYTVLLQLLRQCPLHQSARPGADGYFSLEAELTDASFAVGGHSGAVDLGDDVARLRWSGLCGV